MVYVGLNLYRSLTKFMKPIKSRILLLNESARWWANEKSNSFVFPDRKGDWWIVSPDKPANKPAKKPTNFLKKSQPNKDYKLVLWLAAGFGVSLALKFIAFLLKF